MGLGVYLVDLVRLDCNPIPCSNFVSFILLLPSMPFPSSPLLDLRLVGILSSTISSVVIVFSGEAEDDQAKAQIVD